MMEFVKFMAANFPTLALVKVLVSSLAVVILSVAAERVNPRFAGILSGYPLGAAISLFFFGYEIGPEFAAHSAVYTTMGLMALQAFVCGYLVMAKRFESGSKGWAILGALVGGLGGYLGVAWFVRQLPMKLPLVLGMAVASIILFDRIFRRIENTTIEGRIPFSLKTLLVRALTAAAMILSITASAKLVGPSWAGLLSAFPVTLTPLLVIVHWSYRPEHVYTIIKNVPRGVGALVIYTLAVSYSYRTIGICWGTLLSYVLATIYLVLIHLRGRPAGELAVNRPR